LFIAISLANQFLVYVSSIGRTMAAVI
jgi:hypothetical protein